MANTIRSLLLATALVSVAACSKKAPEQLPPPPVDTPRPAETTPIGPVKGSQEDFVASVAADRIYFDTDKFDVDAPDQETLQRDRKSVV